MRILSSDNVLEYLFTPFASFLSSYSVLHPSSCAYTPQKNEVVEHKNRYLVNIACTLLLHHCVPQWFWGDAILTAYYLINCLPSLVMHDKVPHSILFPSQPLFCLPACLFDYVCFVHILNPWQDKLSTKATKCVFLGYSSLQRGYRCYSPTTSQYFISAYVTFCEDFFFRLCCASLHSYWHVPSSCLTISGITIPTFKCSSPVSNLLSSSTCNHLASGQLISYGSYLHATSPILIRGPTNFHSKRHSLFSQPSSTYNFLTYHHLSSSYSLFLPCLLCLFLRRCMKLYLPQTENSQWLSYTLQDTWDLVSLPTGKSHVACRWVYTIKLGPNGTVDCLKVHLVAKGHTQLYGFNYYDIFSLVAKIAYVRLLLSMATMWFWSLY